MDKRTVSEISADELAERMRWTFGAEYAEELRVKRIDASIYARDLARRFYGPSESERDNARGW